MVRYVWVYVLLVYHTFVSTRVEPRSFWRLKQVWWQQYVWYLGPGYMFVSHVMMLLQVAYVTCNLRCHGAVTAHCCLFTPGAVLPYPWCLCERTVYRFTLRKVTNIPLHNRYQVLFKNGTRVRSIAHSFRILSFKNSWTKSSIPHAAHAYVRAPNCTSQYLVCFCYWSWHRCLEKRYRSTIRHVPGMCQYDITLEV